MISKEDDLHALSMNAGALGSSEALIHQLVKAVSQGTQHEQICALRYQNIEQQLTKIDTRLEVAFTLASTAIRKADVATGVWIGAGGVFTIVGIIYAILRIGGH